MLFTIGLILLAIWGAGLIIPHGFGDLGHLPLLIGLMLLFLALLRARDEAIRRAKDDGTKEL